jgi:phosphatidate cytidylyltransferase
MNNLVQRSLTGLGLVAFIVACIWFGRWTFLFLCLLINGFALAEFYRLIEYHDVRIRKAWSVILSSILLTSVFWVINDLPGWQVILVIIPFSAFMFIEELYSIRPIPFRNLAYTFLGIVWITVPVIFFTGLGFLPFGEGTYQRNILLGYFLILWASDTGAYLAGSVFGKRKLFERVSPKKTWEGSVGGAVITMSISFLIACYFNELHVRSWLFVALLIIVFGTYGDLLKSLLKRSVNVKDSGTLLPGHGGFLDRFDSLIGSAPFVFSYLVIVL